DSGNNVHLVGNTEYISQYVGILNGTPFSVSQLYTPDSSASNGFQFTFYGNLDIPAGSTVTVTGTSPAALYADNDVNIGAGVTFNSNLFTYSPGGDGGIGGSGSQGGTGGGNSILPLLDFFSQFESYSNYQELQGQGYFTGGSGTLGGGGLATNYAYDNV